MCTVNRTLRQPVCFVIELGALKKHHVQSRVVQDSRCVGLESWTKVMNQVWGEPTAIPRVDPSSGKTLMPVLCGEGACTICFKKTQQASDHKSLPFQQISDARPNASDAVLDVAVKFFLVKGSPCPCQQ